MKRSAALTFHANPLLASGLGFILATALLSLSFAGCGTAKAPTKHQWKLNELSQGDLIELVDRQNPRIDYLRSSVQTKIELQGKTQTARVDLALAADHGIRLVVVPFPLVEAGRLWMLPDGAYLSSSMLFGSKTPLLIPWDVLQESSKISLDFCLLRQMLLAQVSSDCKTLALSKRLVEVGSQTPTTADIRVQNNDITFDWRIGSNARPTNVVISRGIIGEYIYWEYEAYNNDAELIPTKQRITLFRDNKPSSPIVLDLNRLNFSMFDLTLLSPPTERAIRISDPDELKKILPLP